MLILILKDVINQSHIIFRQVIFISRFFKIYFIIIISFSIFISIFFIPIFKNNNLAFEESPNKQIIAFNPDGFVWPVPGYNSISSYFGKRKAPTSGASSFHYGIDVPAPEGTNLIAIADGEITFRSFLGAGGYTITLSFDDFKISYCHVSPNFIVSVGDLVKQGQIIGQVGPKYVYGVPGNQYADSSGIPTNRSNNWPSSSSWF